MKRAFQLDAARVATHGCGSTSKRILRVTLAAVIGSLATTHSLLAQAIPDVSDPDNMAILARTIRLSGLWTSLIVILFAWVVLKGIDGVVERLAETFTLQRMLLQKIRALVHFAIYFATIGTVIALSINLSPAAVAILGGSAAVALGFAGKDLVASLVSGILIIVDRPFQVGDRINFGGYYGDVTAIGLRSVRLQTLDDNTVTIPNNLFLGNITSCGNYGALDMQVVIDFHIGASEPARVAHDLVLEAATVSRYIYLGKPVVVAVSQVVLGNTLATRLRLKAYVFDTRYEKAMESDITMRVLDVFAERGIQPPAALYKSSALVEKTQSVAVEAVST